MLDWLKRLELKEQNSLPFCPLLLWCERTGLEKKVSHTKPVAKIFNSVFPFQAEKKVGKTDRNC